MPLLQEDYLEHYGILRKSGRYPWGSGGSQSARNQSFLDIVGGLKKQGLSETQIAEGFGITTTQLRAANSIARNQQKQEQINQAQRLKDKGYSNVAIGERMGLNESSVRALLAPGAKDKADALQTTANVLKKHVDEKKYIDVGTGVENHLGITSTRLNTAVAMLQEQGYTIHYLKVQQLGTGHQTTMKVLAKPNTPYSEVFRNRDQVKQVAEFSEDHGRSYLGIKEPLVVSSKRIGIRYADQGGADADGVIYVRPNVKDLSLGGSRYAQVRIAVDGTHYLKGMAMYKDDLPPGIDLQFNTNKHDTGNKHDAMKPMKDDPDNPFGAVVRQIIAKDAHGVEHNTSAMNIVNEEGDWEGWARSLSRQMLSKQAPELAKHQLAMTYERSRSELDEILSLTNPTVKRTLLEKYADGADSAAVKLKAAALPRQGSHVILPMNSLKDTEIYAPNFKHGETVVLIRYPHAGTFEIPQLTVNNNHPEAKKMLGQAKDAVAINAKVAQHLSGADFDGDTVLVIPNNQRKIRITPALEGLKNFDPQHEFPAYPGMKPISPSRKQQEMGKITNLIADMTVHGAKQDELARAVRHSMVVIDAEKHNLDFQGSERANGIAQLRQKYQPKEGGRSGGASTLITRATSQERVLDRKARPYAQGGPIDRATGRKAYVPTGKTYVDKNGKVVPRRIVSTKLAEATDARKLMSTPEGTTIERIYADHSNALKALANEARKATLDIKPIPQSKSAKAVYANEVATLQSKLNLALRRRPLERQAQVIANATVAAKRRANPDMAPEELKKIKGQALTEARRRTGGDKEKFEITQEEWNAIQAGAIANSKLNQILRVADLDQVRKLATPRTLTVMTPVKIARAKSMFESGYTQAEIANALGVSVSTVKRSVGASNE